MTVAVSNTTPAAFVARINTVAEAANAYFAQLRTYYKACSELNALSTRELDDIGVSRADIRDIAWDHAKRS